MSMTKKYDINKLLYDININCKYNIILQDKFSNRTKYLTTIIISNCINKFIRKIKYETFFSLALDCNFDRGAKPHLNSSP